MHLQGCTALSASYSPLMVKVAGGTSETLSYQPPKQEVLTQSTALSKMLLSFATGEVLNVWWSGDTVNFNNHRCLCSFCPPNTRDTVLWSNLLELLATCEELTHKTQMNCAQQDLSVTYLI